jgi:hypothetical protein
MNPIVNNTYRAVITIALMIFSVGTIVWLLAKGVHDNSLHASALSWSYTMLVACMVGLGVDASITKLLPPPKQ